MLDMKKLFYLLFLLGYALADCPPDLKSNTCCTQNLFLNYADMLSLTSVTLVVANIGPTEYVLFPSGQKLTNRGYFSQSFKTHKDFIITVCTGTNTSMKMKAMFTIWAVSDVPEPTPITLKGESQVMHLSKWTPGTAYSFFNLVGFVIQRAEYVTDSFDLLQWSNIVVLSDSKVVGSLYDLTQNDTLSIFNATLFYSQPISFEGAVLITPVKIMEITPATYSSLSYASPALGDQSMFFDNKLNPYGVPAAGSTGWWTVIGAPDGSIALDVRSVIGNVSVYNASPDWRTTASVPAMPLAKLPARLTGSIWTFYSDSSAAVKFVAVGM